MAYMCVNGGNHECDGCGECRKRHGKPEYYCVVCEDGIYEGDTYYEIDGDTVCEECVDDYVRDVCRMTC